jgi:GDP-D-mannose dehydratase
MKIAKTVLIAKITGQNSVFLADPSLGKGYRVVGPRLDAQMADLGTLQRLGIVGAVELLSLAANDFSSVLKVATVVEPVWI